MTPPDKIETPTPRTDAHRQPFIDRPSFELDDVLEAYELAEQLERELTQWRAVAGILAAKLVVERRIVKAEYGEDNWRLDAFDEVLEAHDALAKLSEKP